MQQSPRYENTSVHGNPLWENVSTESQTSGRETDSPKPATKTKPGNGGNHGREKIIEIRHLDINYDGGVYDVIGNDRKNAPQHAKQGSWGEHHDAAVYDSLNIMTHATQQQMDLFRRMMYLMTLLLVIVFLTAAASLALTVMVMMSRKTSTLNEPTPSPGRLPRKDRPPL